MLKRQKHFPYSASGTDSCVCAQINENEVMGKYSIIGEAVKTETCLECGVVFYGPPNKKFCCDSCRNKYHNREHQEIRNMKLRTHTILEKNYRILSDLLANNVLAIDRGELYMMGYTPGYLTSVIRTRTHEQCTCYDISFRRTAPAQFEKLSEEFALSHIAYLEDGNYSVRICTSWATKDEEVDRLIAMINEL